MTCLHDVEALRGMQGLIVFESPDRGAALSQAWELANKLIPAEHRASEIAYTGPEGDRWTIDELNDQLLYQQAYAPLGDHRIIIVDRADDMDRRAAEHLLKTVEEPPARVLFLFVVESSNNLLTTLLSRTYEVRSVSGRERSEVREGIAARCGRQPSAAVVTLAQRCPRLSGALSRDDATSVLDAVEGVAPAMTGPTCTAAMRTSGSIRSAAGAMSGKNPTHPATRATQRELLRGVLDLLDLEARDALTGTSDTSAHQAVAVLGQVRAARTMLSRHLPIEHVLTTALSGR